MPKYNDVTLTIHQPTEGNAHSIALKVQNALEVVVCRAEAEEFRQEFLALIKDGATDYQQVLALCGRWVNVHYKH